MNNHLIRNNSQSKRIHSFWAANLTKCSLWYHIIFIFLLLFLKAECKKKAQPHIILIYADDLGWNDVSVHGSPQIPTPNIDAMAMSGVTLVNYYGMWLCSPSRGSLLTGKYAIRLGLQHGVINAGERSGLPLSETTLAERLKKLGYATHLVGKWHLGYANYSLTPIRRGYDTFFGYYNSNVDYYDFSLVFPTVFHPRTTEPMSYYGIDIQDGITPALDARGEYATRLFANKAADIIDKHDHTKPLFLQLCHVAVHLGNPFREVMAPPEITDKFSYIKDYTRRIFAAMVAELDTSVGKVFDALDKKGILQNSVVLFVSDNGANVASGRPVSNWPLRGGKFTLWEGGNRVPAIVWSPMFNLTEPRLMTDLVHVTDWAPTLVRAAGGDPKTMGSIDGFDIWKSFVAAEPSPRKDMLYNIDPLGGQSAFRDQHMKVINGPAHFGTVSTITGLENGIPKSMDSWVFKEGSLVRDIMKKNGWWIVKNPDDFYKKTTIDCGKPSSKKGPYCDPHKSPCLFNVTQDPCEFNNLADDKPHIVQHLMNSIHDYEKMMMSPQFQLTDHDGDPVCNNLTYVPWTEKEYSVHCTYWSYNMNAPGPK